MSLSISPSSNQSFVKREPSNSVQSLPAADTNLLQEEDDGYPRQIAQAPNPRESAKSCCPRTREKKRSLLSRFFFWLTYQLDFLGSWKKPPKKKPPVFILDGLLNLDFIKKHGDRFVVLMSGNLDKKGGKYGMSGLLRQIQQICPEVVVELPVAKYSSSIYYQDLKESALQEDTPGRVRSNLKQMAYALDKLIKIANTQGKVVLLLRGGYGTGGSHMKDFAPKTYEGMKKLFETKLGVKYIEDPISGHELLDYTDEAVRSNEADQDWGEPLDKHDRYRLIREVQIEPDRYKLSAA